MEFNLLPLDVHLEIFSYLSVSEVMKIRKVCKQWNSLINCEFRFKRLLCKQTVTAQSDEFERDDESDEYERNCEYDFSFTSIRSFVDYASNRKLSILKFLQVKVTPKLVDLRDAFDLLNSFRSLEQLVFNCYEHDGVEAGESMQLVLSLDRLKKAKFGCLGSSKSKIRVLLNLPSLQYLCWLNPMQWLTIGHPEELRVLVVNRIFKRPMETDFSKFTNLAKFCALTSEVKLISANFIEKLPSLREFHLDYDFYENFHFSLPEPSSGKASVKIFYVGFEFSLDEMAGREWPSLDDFSTNSALFITQNLHRSLEYNPLVYSINYNAMAMELNNETFHMMHRKFSNFNKILIRDNVTDKSQLLKFIETFKLNCLKLERASLGKLFFEKLPQSGQFIRRLVVIEEPEMNILSGDFDFVFKLGSLKKLKFKDSPLSLKFVIRLLRELKEIACVKFCHPGNYTFSLETKDCMTEILFSVSGFDCELIHKISSEEAPEWLDLLRSGLKTDEVVCPRKLLVLGRHLQFEEETHLFMMRKYIYDHTHSICVSEGQMRLLNLLR